MNNVGGYISSFSRRCTRFWSIYNSDGFSHSDSITMLEAVLVVLVSVFDSGRSIIEENWKYLALNLPELNL